MICSTLREAMLMRALSLLNGEEDFVCPYGLLWRAAEDVGLTEGFIFRSTEDSLYDRIGFFLRIGEVETFHLALLGEDLNGRVREAYGVDIVGEQAYTAFVDSLSYRATYPDPRTRLRAILSRMLSGDMHLAPILLPPMNRFKQASEALVHAFEQGTLLPGRYNTCALKAILESAGVNDLRWVNSFQNFTVGIPLEDGVPSFEYYAHVTGYAPKDLVRVEAAFEGADIIPGQRRVSMALPWPSQEMRLEAALSILEELEGTAV